MEGRLKNIYLRIYQNKKIINMIVTSYIKLK